PGVFLTSQHVIAVDGIEIKAAEIVFVDNFSRPAGNILEKLHIRPGDELAQQLLQMKRLLARRMRLYADPQNSPFHAGKPIGRLFGHRGKFYQLLSNAQGYTVLDKVTYDGRNICG